MANDRWASTEARIFSAWPDYATNMDFKRSVCLVNDRRANKNVKPQRHHYQTMEAIMRIRVGLLSAVDGDYLDWTIENKGTEEWSRWVSFYMGEYQKVWEKRKREYEEWERSQKWIGPDGRQYPAFGNAPELGPGQPTWEWRNDDSGSGRSWRIFKTETAEWQAEADIYDDPRDVTAWKLVRGDPNSLKTIVRPEDRIKPTEETPIAKETPPPVPEPAAAPSVPLPSSQQARFQIMDCGGQVLITDSETGETKVLSDANGHQYGIAFAEMKSKPTG